MAELAEAPSGSAPSGKHHSHDTTLNAVSFGFIATAVLFAIFLIMAIFERVLRPHRPFRRRGPTDEELQAGLPAGPSDSQKPELRHVSSYSRSVSVLMPGNDYPTHFAKPIPYPLEPEGVDWPSHGHSAESSQQDPEGLQLIAIGSQKGPALARTFSNSSERWASFRKGIASSS